jgi:hypothetical protein
VGIVVFACLFVSLYRGDASEPQYKVPGSFKTETKEPGRYYLWDNHWTRFEGRRFGRDKRFPASLEITIRSANGAPLEFVKGDSSSWSVGNHAKTSVGYVEIENPGEVLIEVSGHEDEERVLSFSKSEVRQAVGRLFICAGVAVLLMFAGFATSLVGFVRLLFSRQR